MDVEDWSRLQGKIHHPPGRVMYCLNLSGSLFSRDHVGMSYDASFVSEAGIRQAIDYGYVRGKQGKSCTKYLLQ